jgi:hypothetical protein
VNPNDLDDVELLHSKYPGVSHQEIKAAVIKYGPLRKTLEVYLMNPGILLTCFIV